MTTGAHKVPDVKVSACTDTKALEKQFYIFIIILKHIDLSKTRHGDLSDTATSHPVDTDLSVYTKSARWSCLWLEFMKRGKRTMEVSLNQTK